MLWVLRTLARKELGKELGKAYMKGAYDGLNGRVYPLPEDFLKAIRSTDANAWNDLADYSLR